MDVQSVEIRESATAAGDENIHIGRPKNEIGLQTAAPVYAEIWRDGLKVAVIDSRGHVTTLNGLLATMGGSSGGGPELAARRTMQIAHSIGGEIRVAGQAMDGQTLVTRARLQATYSV